MPRSFMWRMWGGLLGTLAALALLGTAQGGGWSVVVLNRESAALVGGSVRPGATLEIGFMVLQHGVRPLSDLSPAITLRPEDGGAPLTVGAVAQGEPGHYVAAITLPKPGIWHWEIDAFGPPSVMAPLTVAAPPPVTAPAPPVALAVLSLVVVALAIVVLLARGARGSVAVPR